MDTIRIKNYEEPKTDFSLDFELTKSDFESFTKG